MLFSLLLFASTAAPAQGGGTTVWIPMQDRRLSGQWRIRIRPGGVEEFLQRAGAPTKPTPWLPQARSGDEADNALGHRRNQHSRQPPPNMTRTFIARALSLIGHPAILTPAAAILSAMSHSAPAKALQLLILVSLCLGAGVFAYSWLQVRSGRWQHVDASVPGERRQLHAVLLLLFFAAAASLWLSGQPPRLVLGPAFCGLLIVLASLFRRWLKMSLHASFAVFAAALVWPHVASTFLVLLLALAVSWSRLVLHRHTRQEVVIGLLSGGTTGLAFNVVATAY